MGTSVYYIVPVFYIFFVIILINSNSISIENPWGFPENPERGKKLFIYELYTAERLSNSLIKFFN